jgi:hypothetical protein
MTKRARTKRARSALSRDTRNVYAASDVATLGHARRARAPPAHRATSHSCGTLAETTQLRILVTANLCLERIEPSEGPVAEEAESMYSAYSVLLVLFMMRRISNGNPCVTYDPAAVVTRVMYSTSIVSALFFFFFLLLRFVGPWRSRTFGDFFFYFFTFSFFLLFHFYFFGDLPHFSSALPFLKKFLFFLFFFFSFFLFFFFLFLFGRGGPGLLATFFFTFFTFSFFFLLFHFYFLGGLPHFSSALPFILFIFFFL